MINEKIITYLHSVYPELPIDNNFIRGYSDDEIAKIERLYDIKVTDQLYYFLRCMGRCSGGLFGDVPLVFYRDQWSVPNVSTSTTQTNYNHAEQKLFSHIQDTYKGKKADINVAVQNTSKYDPGMCVSCGSTSQSFAEANKNFNINIFQGTTGKNP